jgi:hypothetical protein
MVSKGVFNIRWTGEYISWYKIVFEWVLKNMVFNLFELRIYNVRTWVNHGTIVYNSWF